MLRRIFLFLFVISATGVFSQQSEFPKIADPYLGQKPPVMIPEIFAPGIISKNGSDEWGLAVNANWTEIFFSRAENDKSSIYYLRRGSNSRTEPAPARFSGIHNDSHPAFSGDGTKLFFGSKRPCKGAKSELNLWYVDKINGDWSDPKTLGIPFINQTVHAASVSSEGNIYATGLVVFEKDNSGYKSQHKLQPNIMGSHPAVSPDGSYIIFSKNEQSGFGGNDLYVIYKKENETWCTPINLGKEINTKYVESSPTISLDGKFIFFSRNGDIWWVSTKCIEELRQKE